MLFLKMFWTWKGFANIIIRIKNKKMHFNGSTSFLKLCRKPKRYWNYFAIQVEITITCLHLAASESFNAINLVAATLVESSHEIVVPFAVAPSLFVERNDHIFIITVIITVRVTLWAATFCFVNVVQELRWSFAQSETVHIITIRTQRPDFISSKKGKYFIQAIFNNLCKLKLINKNSFIKNRLIKPVLT